MDIGLANYLAMLSGYTMNNDIFGETAPAEQRIRTIKAIRLQTPEQMNRLRIRLGRVLIQSVEVAVFRFPDTLWERPPQFSGQAEQTFHEFDAHPFRESIETARAKQQPPEPAPVDGMPALGWL